MKKRTMAISPDSMSTAVFSVTMKEEQNKSMFRMLGLEDKG
jgi:hypothetical protein